MPSAGETRREFEARLLDDWHALAVELEIPEATKKTWNNGREAAGIWVWLESRGALAQLSDALVSVERSDLVDLIRSLPPSAFKPPLVPIARGWLIGLAVLVVAIPAIVTAKAILFPGPQRMLLAVEDPFDLANPAPLGTLLPGQPTRGLQLLTEDVGQSFRNQWFGIVTYTGRLPQQRRHPLVEVEVLYGKNHANDSQDVLDMYWLAPDKDHEPMEISYRNLTLDQGWARVQHDRDIAVGMMLVIVFRYRESREHSPTINVWIK